jgi:Ca2+-binding EF-hand superfamily protein
MHAVQVSEVRDAFDFFDDETTGELAPDQMDNVLQRLGLTLEQSEIDGLFQRHVLSQRPDAETVRLVEFMYLFQELDANDAGIQMI